MKKSELEELIKTEADKSIEEKMGELINEQVDSYLKDQLQEQLNDAIAKINPPQTEEEKAVNNVKKEKRFKTFGEYLNAIYMARHYGKLDKRLVYLDSEGRISKPELTLSDRQEKVMTEGTDSAGGFLVFEEFIAQILQVGLEASVIRSHGPMVIPMKSDTINIPRVDDTSHASSVYGGVVAYWTEEAGTKTATDMKWGNTKLTAHELSGYTVASNALLADSAIALEPYLKRVFGEAWSFFEDDAFINGNGTGQPLGILNAPVTISPYRNTTSHVYFEDLVTLYTRMLPRSRGKAIWLVNHEVLPELIQMGAGSAAPASGHQLVWISKDMGATKGIPGTIFGRPFFVTEKMQALGTAGDIGFFDLSYYLIGDRQALTIDASTHVYFTSNKTAWRFVLRCDGQPWLESAITPEHGSNTLSPFVILSASTS